MKLINILIRTSNRPKYFKHCIEAVKEQTYGNYRIIVSVDNPETNKYVSSYDIVDKVVNVEYRQPSSIKNIPKGLRSAPWNSYFNEMLKHTKDGYVIYIDDDDKLLDKNSLQILVNNIKTNDELVMWQVKFPGRFIPNDINWKKYKQGHKPIPAQISTLGFSHPTKYNAKINWTPYSFGDYRISTTLHNLIKHKTFIDTPLTTLQRATANGLGRRDDLKQ